MFTWRTGLQLKLYMADVMFLSLSFSLSPSLSFCLTIYKETLLTLHTLSLSLSLSHTYIHTHSQTFPDKMIHQEGYTSYPP